MLKQPASNRAIHGSKSELVQSQHAAVHTVWDQLIFLFSQILSVTVMDSFQNVQSSSSFPIRNSVLFFCFQEIKPQNVHTVFFSIGEKHFWLITGNVDSFCEIEKEVPTNCCKLNCISMIQHLSAEFCFENQGSMQRMVAFSLLARTYGEGLVIHSLPVIFFFQSGDQLAHFNVTF